jgi:hypothetical protein
LGLFRVIEKSLFEIRVTIKIDSDTIKIDSNPEHRPLILSAAYKNNRAFSGKFVSLLSRAYLARR